MIFITLGTQKFEFNRLLEEIDRLVSQNELSEHEIIAQIGYSTYIPKNYKYKKIIERDKFEYLIENCDILITHGGTGAIVSACKKNKKVIACPRLQKYGEHVDNHQLEIVNKFQSLGMILACREEKDLNKLIKEAHNFKAVSFVSNTVEFNKNISKLLC